MRSRERILLSNVDETQSSLDANISEELLKLQSVYSHCQALFKNLSAFSGNAGIISNITSTLAEVNCREKSDFKPLIFYSDFEEMKSKADTYGYLDGDFVKRDDFYVSGDSVVQRECADQAMSASNTNHGTSYCLEKSSSEGSDIEETFQVINLIDNMHCNDLEDYAMVEEGGAENCQQLKKKLDEVYERESKVSKKCVNTEELHKMNVKKFFPEKEWKHLLELNKRLDEFKSSTSKINDLKERYTFNKEKLHVLQKDADNWLFNKNFRKDVTRKEKNDKNTNAAVNIVSPADLIQKSFQSYQVKGDTKYWLTSN